MPKIRPDGAPLTPDDLEFWNKPYTFQEFPKILYRRQRSGIARRPTSETFMPEGTNRTPDGTVLEYLTVQSVAAETIAGTEGWADFTTAIGGGTTPLPNVIK
jgi:hypothetical protein